METNSAAITRFSVDQTVTFRPEFSEALTGVAFIVDSTEFGQDTAGRQMIGLKRLIDGVWGHRLAYADDLIAANS